MTLLMAPVRQQVADQQVEDVTSTVRQGLAALPLAERVQPGMQVAVAVGSRGISCYAQVVKTTVKALQEEGAEPFLVPAMGSHGGGTAEGQRQVLLDSGMGPDELGVPLHSSLETVRIGTTPEGMPVYWDKHAAAADAVIVINRVKAHTAFHAPWESGLFKILAIGLGKKQGAATIHSHGVAAAMPAAARVAIAQKPVVAGIAIVENGHHQPARIDVIPGERIEQAEPPLLALAKQLQPRIPLEPLDLLIVQEMGKDISGTGMDTNVIGIWRRNGGPVEPDYRCVVALDLTEASHGNASGVGMADLISQRLQQKIDWHATYTNCLTAGNYAGAKLPIPLPTDQAVVETALTGQNLAQARVVLVRNTLELETFWVSAALLPEVARSPLLTQVGEAQSLQFDGGALVPLEATAGAAR